jgi:photosystem II stability/assembly factor-like uncharacterized protein
MKAVKYLVLVPIFYFSCCCLAQQPLINHFTDIFALNSNSIWVVESDGILYHTTDAGNSWIEYGNYLIPDSKIFFINSTEGWRISGDRIYYTTSSGENWLLNFEVLDFNFRDINFLNDSIGFTLGFDSEKTQIFRTTNAGLDWSVVFDSSFTSIPTNLHQIYTLDLQNIWAMRDNVIYYSSDLGDNWETRYYTQVVVGFYFDKLIFFDSFNGILGFDFDDIVVVGKLLYTTDGGNTFQDYGSSNFNLGLSSFYFTSGSTGWVATGNTEIKFTQNSGNSWEVLQDNNSLSYIIYKFSPIDDTLSWAISPNEILYSEDGWHTFSIKGTISDVDNNSNDALRKFSLSQNYPNPFNPSTKIKFTIPSIETHRDASLLVTLKVYDILGNEIATLVNEEKQPGTYEVEFNPASSLKNPAAGVYFYQLKSGNFVETKKMLLLK